MKKKLQYLVLMALSTLVFFAIGKVAFVLWNGPGRGVTLADVAGVLWHGLPLDVSTMGYVLALPWLLTWLSVHVSMPRLRQWLTGYYLVVALVLSIIVVADVCLYSFWDFKLDATVFAYLDSPRNAAASVSAGYIAVAALAVLTLAGWLAAAWRRATPRRLGKPMGRGPQWADAAMALVGGLLFLGIRGGVGRSTANIGMVYYAQNQFLNHAAVNPAFSLLYSSMHMHNLKGQGQFFDEPRRARLMGLIDYPTVSEQPDTLLTTTRPNVLIILLESMGGTFVEAVGGAPGITPNLNRMAREGVLFTRCYANSYRTDRGVVCALSGEPSFPQLSVMKMPERSRHLPSIARTLQAAGYDTDFMYGGDINFTNMQSYLRATGYRRVTGDTDFPLSQRRTHAWGVADHIVLARLLRDITARPTQGGRPWMTTLLTLSSHEPWKVPYNRFPRDERANAMAYVDHYLGLFLDSLRHTPQWRNLLVVMLPDHGTGYPTGTTEQHLRRYHIPMVWTGGAVARARRIDKVCNQSDLPATLLGQMRLSHADFAMSRDVSARNYRRPFAMHTFDNGFAAIDSAGGYTVFDLSARRVTTALPHPDTLRLELGKAVLQTSYNLLRKQ